MNIFKGFKSKKLSLLEQQNIIYEILISNYQSLEKLHKQMEQK